MDRILIATPVKDATRHFDTYFAALSCLTYPADHLSLGFLESDSADDTYARLNARLPDLRRRYRRVGLCKRDLGRVEEALPIFLALTAVDPETLMADLAYDARLFGVWAISGLALCCFRLGRYEESARYYARAERLAPDDGHDVRRRLAEARASRVIAPALGAVVGA